MADGITLKLEGAKALHDALGEMKKATERSLLRRVGIKALEPIAERASQLAAIETGQLRDSFTVGTKLTKRAKAAARKDPVDGVRVFAGSASRNAVPREFGTARTAPKPALRPAWDGGKSGVLDAVQEGLAIEIEKTRKRAARRAASKG